jgi:hypothetical protein
VVEHLCSIARRGGQLREPGGCVVIGWVALLSALFMLRKPRPAGGVSLGVRAASQSQNRVRAACAL